MSARRPLRRQEDFERTEGGADIPAILMIVTGGVLFMALATHTPDDLAAWTGISTKEPPNDPALNFFGPLGATVAGYLFFLLGGASYLLPFGLLWLGMAKINMGLKLLPRPVAGFALFVFSASVFLGAQSWWFQEWKGEYNILGPGGGIGWMGYILASKTINTAGALILSATGYLCGLILMTGIRPRFVVVKTQRALLTAWRQIWFRLSGQRRLLLTDLENKEAVLLMKEQAKAERERRRLEKELRRQPAEDLSGAQHVPLNPGGALALESLDAEILGGPRDPSPAATSDEDEEDAQPLAAVSEVNLTAPAPEPLIIDGSRRNKPAGEGKLSLAEWRKQQQKPRDESGTGSGAAGGAPAMDFSNYQLPPLNILHWDESAGEVNIDERGLRETQKTIIATLGTFGIQVTPGPITRGPTISRYEIYPSEGLRVNRITALEADIARATRAERINILAPIPGKDTVGIEIANNDKVAVTLRELLEDDTFARTKSKLPLALGKDVYGNTIIADLAAMPHLLVAGATGSGKSVCINSIIGSLLFQFTPQQLRFIMIDPKVVEMQTYNDLPHLVVPVVTDPKKVIMALRWVVNEMEHRYRLFAGEGVRNFESFNNRKRKEKPAAPDKLRSAAKPEKSAATAGLPLFEAASSGDIVSPSAELPEPAAEPLPSLKSKRGKEVSATEDGEYVFLAPSDEEENYPEPEPVAEEEPQEEVLAMHQVAIADTADEPAGEIWDESELIAEEEADSEPQIPDSIPYIVVIIDELADLMQTAPADMEQLIQRIAQKARAAGIHMILATQTPRAEVITGNIKANIPCRIAFQVSSALDSRVILDTKGAEKLVGKGDMLYLPPGTSKLLRAQGAYVTDDEIFALVDHCKLQAQPAYDKAVQETLGDGPKEIEKLTAEDEETLERCIEVIMVERKASTSLLQRRLRLGYGRAARMMDLLEQRGFIGPGDGAKPREVLIAPDEEEMD
jgi:S-DNA-T family DNA segregation ATPase FtsK/SpoIIIE